jgi:hypothetical protein
LHRRQFYLPLFQTATNSNSALVKSPQEAITRSSGRVVPKPISAYERPRFESPGTFVANRQSQEFDSQAVRRFRPRGQKKEHLVVAVVSCQIRPAPAVPVRAFLEQSLKSGSAALHRKHVSLFAASPRGGQPSTSLDPAWTA